MFSPRSITFSVNRSKSKDIYFIKRHNLKFIRTGIASVFFPYIFPYTLNNSLQKTLNNLRKVLSVLLSFRRLFLTYYHRFRHPLRFKSLSLRQIPTFTVNRGKCGYFFICMFRKFLNPLCVKTAGVWTNYAKCRFVA